MVAESSVLIVGVIFTFLGVCVMLIALHKLGSTVTATIMIMLIAILMFIGGSILYGYQGMCSFLGKPLTVQNLAVGKDLVAVAQIFSYTLIAEATKKEDLRVVKGLPPMAPETIFIVAERNGKKIVITVPKEK